MPLHNRRMAMQVRNGGYAVLAAVALLAGGTGALAAEPAPPPPTPPVATYADLADLADSSSLVLRAQVRKTVRVEPERAVGVRPGWGRFYAEARTRSLLSGSASLGEALRYLVDLPLDARGKAPQVKGREFLLFGRPVAGRPGELQLVAPDAQLPWDQPLEDRLRGVLRELLSPDAPPHVTGVREAIYVPGTLAGEGETQLFLSTADESAAAITVRHAPGGATTWGVTFSELVGEGAPPARETLAWYRLACFLPNVLPRRANVSDTPANRQQADADYRQVLGELGRCERLRQ